MAKSLLGKGVSLNDINMFDELEKRLKEHRYVYPPYLGRVNYLASIKYIDRLELEELKETKNTIEVISICATNTLSEFDIGSCTIITNVPMAYKAKKTKFGIKLNLGSLANIIYSDKPLQIKPRKSVHQIKHSNIEELKGKNIIFLPFN